MWGHSCTKACVGQTAQELRRSVKYIFAVEGKLTLTGKECVVKGGWCGSWREPACMERTATNGDRSEWVLWLKLSGAQGDDFFFTSYVRAISLVSADTREKDSWLDWLPNNNRFLPFSLFFCCCLSFISSSKTSVALRCQQRQQQQPEGNRGSGATGVATGHTHMSEIPAYMPSGTQHDIHIYMCVQIHINVRTVRKQFIRLPLPYYWHVTSSCHVWCHIQWYSNCRHQVVVGCVWYIHTYKINYIRFMYHPAICSLDELRCRIAHEHSQKGVSCVVGRAVLCSFFCGAWCRGGPSPM